MTESQLSSLYARKTNGERQSDV